MFFIAAEDGTKGNLQQWWFSLDLGKNSITAMVLSHWNGLPKEAVFGGFSQTEQIPVLDDLGILIFSGRRGMTPPRPSQACISAGASNDLGCVPSMETGNVSLFQTPACLMAMSHAVGVPKLDLNLPFISALCLQLPYSNQLLLDQQWDFLVPQKWVLAVGKNRLVWCLQCTRQWMPAAARCCPLYIFCYYSLIALELGNFECLLYF